MLAHLHNKAAHLGAVEKFITQIELKLLRDPSGAESFGPVREALDELRELSGDNSDPETAARVEQHLAKALETWQIHLGTRDQNIEAYHIRRYCDGLREPLAPSVFLSLTRFYRDRPRTRDSQSKFDLVLTRAFSTTINDLFRSMSMSREQIQAELEKLYGEWDRSDRPRSSDIGAVDGFDRFIAENENLSDFPSLRASRQFDRIREYKADLGDRFWEPAVAAAAVECNIVVGNHFNGLLARESEDLGERFSTSFDLAGTLQDTSPNVGERVSEVLRELDLQVPLLSDRSPEVDESLVRTIIDLSSRSSGSGDRPPSIFDVRLDAAIEEFRMGRLSIGQCEDRLAVETGLRDEDKQLLFADLPSFGDEAVRSLLALALLRANFIPGHTETVDDPLLAHEVERAESAADQLMSSFVSPASQLLAARLANTLLRQILQTERHPQISIPAYTLPDPPKPEIIN